MAVDQGSNGMRLKALCGLLLSMRLSFCRLLEIGSYAGGSARIWSDFIGSAIPQGGVIMCVDTWCSYMHPEDLATGGLYAEMDAELRSGAVYEEFMKVVAQANPRACIDHFKGTAQQFEQMKLGVGKFDCVYIDGSHAYSMVKADIEVARRMVRPGGIICGDDLEAQYHEMANAEHYRPLAERDYIDGIHPGPMFAVHEAFGPVWSRHGAWAVRA